MPDINEINSLIAQRNRQIAIYKHTMMVLKKIRQTPMHKPRRRRVRRRRK